MRSDPFCYFVLRSSSVPFLFLCGVRCVAHHKREEKYRSFIRYIVFRRSLD